MTVLEQVHENLNVMKGFQLLAVFTNYILFMKKFFFMILLKKNADLAFFMNSKTKLCRKFFIFNHYKAKGQRLVSLFYKFLASFYFVDIKTVEIINILPNIRHLINCKLKKEFF